MPNDDHKVEKVSAKVISDAIDEVMANVRARAAQDDPEGMALAERLDEVLNRLEDLKEQVRQMCVPSPGDVDQFAP